VEDILKKPKKIKMDKKTCGIESMCIAVDECRKRGQFTLKGSARCPGQTHFNLVKR
jgi:hypothetical protein